MGFFYETAAPDRYDLLKHFAKSNRLSMTESETILWEALRKEIRGFHFRRQHPIGDYIADFVCLSCNLVIEVDGAYHEQPLQQVDDEVRTRFLTSRGFTVIRIWNEEIKNDLPEVIERIKNYLYNE